MNVRINTPKHWYNAPSYTLTEDVTVSGVTVPKGFTTDGTTLSRWVALLGLIMILLAHITSDWLFILGAMLSTAPLVFPRVGKFFYASVVHDFLLKTSSRYVADEKYFEVLSDLRASSAVKYIAYSVVKIWSFIKQGGN